MHEEIMDRLNLLLGRNPDEISKLVIDVAGLVHQKHELKERGVLDSDTAAIIESAIDDLIWLYDTGYMNAMDPREHFNDDERERYERLIADMKYINEFHKEKVE